MQVHAFNLPLKSAEAPTSLALPRPSTSSPFSLHAKAAQSPAFSLSQALPQARADSSPQPARQANTFTLPQKTTGSPASIALSQASTAPPFSLPLKAAHKSAWIHPGKSSESAPNTSPQNAGQSPTWPGIRLFVRSGSREASTLVVFNEVMTEGLDPGFDIGLMSNGHDPEIFTSLVGDNGNWFARQALPLTFVEGGNQVHYDEMGCDEALWGKGIGGQYMSDGSSYNSAIHAIPIGVNSHKGGPLTFIAEIRLPGSEEGDACSGLSTFFLEDRELEIFTDLHKDAYTATLPANTSGTGRFFLHYSPANSLPVFTSQPGIRQGNPVWEQPIRFYRYRNELIILLPSDDHWQCEVYDLAGRIIFRGSIQGTGNPKPSNMDISCSKYEVDKSTFTLSARITLQLQGKELLLIRIFNKVISNTYKVTF
jgi:hypothetical protein